MSFPDGGHLHQNMKNEQPLDKWKVSKSVPCWKVHRAWPTGDCQPLGQRGEESRVEGSSRSVVHTSRATAPSCSVALTTWHSWEAASPAGPLMPPDPAFAFCVLAGTLREDSVTCSGRFLHEPAELKEPSTETKQRDCRVRKGALHSENPQKEQTPRCLHL